MRGPRRRQAFVRFKQSRFEECVADFEEQEKLVILGAAGAESGTTEGGFCRSIALNENIGHALSSMQRLDEAQARFTSALELLRGQEKLASPEAWVESEMRGDVGGILLGLG